MSVYSSRTNLQVLSQRELLHLIWQTTSLTKQLDTEILRLQISNISLVSQNRVVPQNNPQAWQAVSQYNKYTQQVRDIIQFCGRNRRCEGIRDILAIFDYRDLVGAKGREWEGQHGGEDGGDAGVYE